jgi:hypothetical protein
MTETPPRTQTFSADRATTMISTKIQGIFFSAMISAVLLAPGQASAQDTKAIDEALSRSMSAAKDKAASDLGKVSAVQVKHASKVEEAKRKAGFDGNKFQTALTELHKNNGDAVKSKDATDKFVQSWQDPVAKVLGNLGINLNAEAQALAAQLSASILGGSSLSFGASGGGSASTDLPPGTQTVTVPGKAGPLVPIRAVGLAHASPVGLLHAHAVTHDPLGNIAQSAAGYSAEIKVPAGTKRLIVDFRVDVPLAISLAAVAGGAAASEAALVVRVLEHRAGGPKEVCIGHQSITRAMAAVAGVAPVIRVATWATAGCKVLRETPNQEQRYTVVVQGIASAAVKAVGGSHAVLDLKVSEPKVFFDR